MYRKQKTISQEVTIQGIGLHSGQEVTLTIKPAPENYGIRFIRVDLPNHPEISAFFKNVVDTSLATVIGRDGAIVSTIEHLMASLSAFEIDNVIIEMDAYEVPIMDGSAWPFVEVIQRVGVKSQKTDKQYFVVKSPIQLEEGGKRVSIEPYDSYKISCEIDFNHPLLGNQNLTLTVTPQTFSDEISRARTFGFIQELDYLRRFGLAKGGSLDNAIVIDKDSVLNEDGLRFPDEFVRHKILDSIGDFSLLGMPIIGHITMFKTGHAFHHAFLDTFFINRNVWETKTILE